MKVYLKIFSSLIVFVGLVCSFQAQACTTGCATKSNKVLYSFDWTIGSGYLMMNSKNIHKKSFMMLVATETQKEWVSQYASITFNITGPVLPLAGMNEKGLTVTSMWLNETDYPPKDGRPEIGELQFMQFLLDTSATLDEALANAQSVNPSKNIGKIHYMVCESGCNCAAIEFLGGKMVVNKMNPAQGKPNILANYQYRTAMGLANGTMTLNGGFNREKRMADFLSLDTGSLETSQLFGGLNNVLQRDWTRWHIIFDPVNKTVSYRSFMGYDSDRNLNGYYSSAPIQQVVFDSRLTDTCREREYILPLWDDSFTGLGNSRLTVYTARDGLSAQRMVRKQFPGIGVSGMEIGFLASLIENVAPRADTVTRDCKDASSGPSPIANLNVSLTGGEVDSADRVKWDVYHALKDLNGATVNDFLPIESDLSLSFELTKNCSGGEAACIYSDFLTTRYYVTENYFSLPFDERVAFVKEVIAHKNSD